MRRTEGVEGKRRRVVSSGGMRAPPNLSRQQRRVRDSAPWRRTDRRAVPSGTPPERGEGELVVRRCLGPVCDAGRGGAAPAPASSAAAASSKFSPQSRLGAGARGGGVMIGDGGSGLAGAAGSGG